MSDATENSPQPSRLARLWRDWGKPILIVVIVATSFRSAIADWNDVPTGSMRPTIIEGDRIFIDKMAYDLRVPFTNWRLYSGADPERGDIVIANSPVDGIRLVKRVVGIPGDTIEFVDGRLLINDEVQHYDVDPPTAQSLELTGRESIDAASHRMQWLRGHAHRRNVAPIVVPEGLYFLLGDNRDNSLDSRSFGCVARDQIYGRASHVVVSLDPEFYHLPRAERWWQPLD